MTLRPLPQLAQTLCDTLQVPPNLRVHLQLVHDSAVELVGALQKQFPCLEFDANAVLLGAATHDIGKVIHPEEVAGPGRQHEKDGPELLQRQGLPAIIARFARTHGQWRDADDLSIEDLLVSLADKIWKGRRDEALEALLVRTIGQFGGAEQWMIFARLDDLCSQIASRADERLALAAGGG